MTPGKLFTSRCFCHQAVYFGMTLKAVMPYSWEGNCELAESNEQLVYIMQK